MWAVSGRAVLGAPEQSGSHQNGGQRNNRYRYNGKELESATGFYEYGARWYDAAVGRWLAGDPLASEFPSWGSYSYTFNNPIRFIDPDGRAPQSPIFGQDGKFLGTDSEGFKGDIVIMREKTYNALTNNGTETLDHSLTEKIVGTGNSSFAQTLDDYVANDFNLSESGDREFLSNVFTNLISEASREGIIDYNTSQLENRRFRIAAESSGSAHFYDANGKDRITVNIQLMSYKEQQEGYFSGTQSVHFLGNSGDAINILGVHEPMHRNHPGPSGHQVIDPFVLNAKTNPAIRLASPAYKAKVERRISRNKKK